MSFIGACLAALLALARTGAGGPRPLASGRSSTGSPDDDLEPQRAGEGRGLDEARLDGVAEPDRSRRVRVPTSARVASSKRK